MFQLRVGPSVSGAGAVPFQGGEAMIWCRPLSAIDHALLRNTGLDDRGMRLVGSGAPCSMLVTGLDGASRERLGELVGAAWRGGGERGVVVDFSSELLELWLRSLEPGPLRTALVRLQPAAPPTSVLGRRRFDWGTRTFVMGIVNVTPDSFSDGGSHATTQSAIDFAQTLRGADLIDVGGESTRPGAQAVTEAEELRRVIPVIEALASGPVPVSVDTRKPGVARAAIAAGASLINDVSGLRDDAMLEALAETGAHACVMHMRGTPETMQANVHYDDVVTEVLDGLEAALARAEARGVARARLWVDPGLGFGKGLEANLTLLRRARDFRLLGCPVVFGASRKAFIGTLTDKARPAERTDGSLGVAAGLAATGAVDVLRVHDVAQTLDALKVVDAFTR